MEVRIIIPRMEQQEIDTAPSRRKEVLEKAKSRMTGRKLGTMIVVGLIHVAAIFALLRAFDIDVVPQAMKSITSFSVPFETTPEEPEEKVEEIEPEGASGEEAPEAKAREVSAPPAVIPKKVMPAPPASSTGDENRSGAAQEGTGTGGGGPGVGTGSGGEGNGSGGVPFQRRAEKIAGEIRAKDYPRGSASERDGAYVIVHFTVMPDGTTRNCRVARSSGNAEVDRITCQLVIERFRYRPAIDGNGDPTSEKVGWKQWWWQ